MGVQLLPDTELMALLSEDSEQAFRELYDRYWYKLYVLAHRKLRRREVAEELAQELFVMLWQKRKSLQISNVQAFLNVSLKNLMIDYIRRNIQQEHYLIHLRRFFPTETYITDEAIHFDELTEAIEQKLALLPQKTRDIFMLNRFEHLTIHEIALRLNLSEKAIEYHLSRSTTFLRHNLRDFIAVWVILLARF